MKIRPSNPGMSVRLAILAVTSILTGGAAMAAPGDPRAKPPVPDFTQGGVKDENHDWRLGPTGARGWVHGWKGPTTEARQILVTAVAAGSPADGVPSGGDVILGVGERPFDDDDRIQFAKAITAAEREAAGGRLELIRWRGGKTDQVELKLPVMGTYSATAPYDCQKSKKLTHRTDSRSTHDCHP